MEQYEKAVALWRSWQVRSAADLDLRLDTEILGLPGGRCHTKHSSLLIMSDVHAPVRIPMLGRYSKRHLFIPSR